MDTLPRIAFTDDELEHLRQLVQRPIPEAEHEAVCSKALEVLPRLLDRLQQAEDRERDLHSRCEELLGAADRLSVSMQFGNVASRQEALLHHAEVKKRCLGKR